MNSRTVTKFQPNKPLKPPVDVDLFISLIAKGDVGAVHDYLCQYPEVVNIKEKSFGNVGIHVATSKGNVQILAILLNCGANLGIQDIYGNSALHYACDKSRIDAAEALIKSGSQLNAQDFRGNTPLHVACGHDDVEMVRLLLKHHASTELRDLAGLKPIGRTRSVAVKSLIERKLKADQGGESEVVANTMAWMSFGIGLGVGMGMAMAKQQEAYQEEVRRREEEKKRRRSMMSEGGESVSTAMVSANSKIPQSPPNGTPVFQRKFIS